MTPTEKYRELVSKAHGFSSWQDYCHHKQLLRDEKIKAKLIHPCRVKRTAAQMSANEETPPVDVPMDREFINQVALDRILNAPDLVNPAISLAVNF